jgi:hypothetical protein
MLGFAIDGVFCVIDENIVDHHGLIYEWRNFARAAGERDGYIPNKYFREMHYAFSSAMLHVWVVETDIHFFSDQYNYTWHNDGELVEIEEYHYWCGNAQTKIVTEFHDIFGNGWVDTAWAVVKATGGIE